MNKQLLLIFAILLGLLAPAASTCAKPAPAGSVDVNSGRTLYTVGYAHLDTQWRWSYPMSIREFIPDTLHDNFALLDKYPDYIFNFSGANRYRMMKEYYPADYEKLKGYIAAGRWFPCGSSMEECDVNTTSAESIIRQVLYGNHYFRSEFGTASEEFMLPDCFGFPASLPSLLAHCGLAGFSTQKLTWGSANGIPFNVGVWEGLDGRSVFAAFNPGSYGAQVKEDLSRSEGWLKRITEDGEKSGVFADYMYYGTGDVGGSPTAPSVRWIEQSVRGDGPLQVLATPADRMFLDLKRGDTSRLPRYKGDLLLTQHSAGSITSQAVMKRWNHENELLAASAEGAAVMAQWLGAAEYPQARLNGAWTLVMGGQFHDILPGTSHPDAYVYSTGDEALALNQFADVLESSVAAVASGLDTQTGGTPVVVYNPLGFDREDVVEAELADGTPLKAVRVTGPDRKEVPAQLVAGEGGAAKVLFLARVPSLGFAVYDVQGATSAAKPDGVLKASESALENARYRVSLDGNGDIASIFDKAAGRELLSAPARLAFTTDIPGYWPAWNMDWADMQKPPRGYVEGPAKVRIAEQGPVRVALEVTRQAEGSTFVQTVSLAAGTPGDRVEVKSVIDWRGRECNLKAVFPLTVSNPLATYNWEVGTLTRGNNDEKKYEVPAHQWFDLTDKDGAYGVSVLAPFKYGSDKPDDATLRLTLLRTPGTKSNDYKDQSWQDWGRHEITYGIYGHQGSWREGQSYFQALRLEQPFAAFRCAKHGGKLGRELSLLHVSNPAIRVMALKKAEDGAEIIVRLVELDGREQQDVRVDFAAPLSAAREVDGQERPLGEARLVDGSLAADFTPYALRTFAVTPAQPGVALAAPRSTPVALPCDTCVATRDGEIAEQGFDPDGRSLAAEMLPSELVSAGVSFKLAPAGGGQPNAVKCRGQQIALPAGKYSRLYLLTAGSPGDQQAAFKLGRRVYDLTIQDWGGHIGQWDTRLWDGEIPEMAFQWPWPYRGLAPGYMKRTPVAWFCSHRHTALGHNDPYEYTYLYRNALDVPPDATVLTLPDNPLISVLAVTLAADTFPACTPAQPLYDTLAGHPGEKVEAK